jgi:uncharacterized protein (TIGR00369 family)
LTSDRSTAVADPSPGTPPGPPSWRVGPPKGPEDALDGPPAGVRIAPHHCFACGELNVHGIHLRLHADATGCWTETALEPRFQGWEEVVHGGIVCTLLDEVMAWSVIGRGTWGVTARMQVDFKRPVPIGRPIRAEGRVVDARRRVFRTEGRIVDPGSGELLASADAVFVAVPADRLGELRARYGLGPVPAAASAAPAAQE